MIYFDNAATTKYKPDEVIDALNFYMREVGVSPGRGSYSLGIEASRMLYQSRVTIGNFFEMSSPERVVFTKNSTEAINLLFSGLLNKGDHVIITCYEHNAVLRPLHMLREKGLIDYSVIKREDLDLSGEELFQKYVRSNTRLLAVTYASNLTGRIVYQKDWMTYFHNKGIVTFVDSSQGAGTRTINMKADCVDYLAFTGHKDLYGVPGAGGLCCELRNDLRPLIQGGTGIHGEGYVNPDIFPEGLEAGTVNMPAIWALRRGVQYLNENYTQINKIESDLMKYLLTGLESIEGVTVYDCNRERVHACCFTMKRMSTDKIVALLDKNGICVRGGIHCAILAHEAIGTVTTGAVRISPNYRNTRVEIDQLINILRG